MKNTTIYERQGVIYKHSSSKTTSGVWVFNLPCLSVQSDDVPGIGESIVECLEASKTGVPHPTSFAGLTDPLLKLVGVKSFNTFAKSTKCVVVRSNTDGHATLHPTRNGGPKEGFVYLPGTIEVSLEPVDGLGAAALEALAASE